MSAFGSFVSEAIFKDIAVFKTNNAVHDAWQLDRQHNDVVLIPLPCGSDAACGCNVERFGMCEARDKRRPEIHLIQSPCGAMRIPESACVNQLLMSPQKW